MQSPRFGVTPISQTISFCGYIEEKSVPGFIFSSSLSIPAVSSHRSSSEAEQIIPLDSTPLMSLLSIKKLSFISDLGRATGTIAPISKFHAPQTISKTLFPVSTFVTLTLSALG